MKSHFVWYELMTTDIEGAKAFYNAVVGYEFDFKGGDYLHIMGPEDNMGGVQALPANAAEMGVPSHWYGYVRVDDVVATAAKVTELGGRIIHPPSPIDGGANFVVFSEPTGTVLAAYSDGNPDWMPFKEPKTGVIVWNECMAGDLDTAWGFFQEIFGWEVTETMTMEAGAEYRMYKAPGGENSLGGIMTKPDMVPAAHWLFYMNCEDIVAGVQRVKDNGGTVMMGPMEIPGGEYVAVCFDPQGAAFAIHSLVNSEA